MSQYMVVDVARKLNQLHRDSEPVKLVALDQYVGTTCHPCGLEYVARLLAPILQAAMPQALHEEIQDAAAASRVADHVTYISGWRFRNVPATNRPPAMCPDPTPLIARAAKLCGRELLLAIEGDNAARMANYQEYRAACIAGTATA